MWMPNLKRRGTSLRNLCGCARMLIGSSLGDEDHPSLRQEVVATKDELKEILDAVVPVVSLVAAEGDNTRPLLDLVKEVPSRFEGLCVRDGKVLCQIGVRASSCLPPRCRP